MTSADAIVATLPPEIRLLCAGIAAGIHGHALPPVSGVSPETLATAARRHRVTLLLPPGWGNGTAHPLAAQRRKAAISALVSAAALARVSKALEAAGVTVLALKGPAFAAQIHGDPLRRSSLDIDLLIPPAVMPRALAVLAGCGYENPLGSVPRDHNAFHLVCRNGGPPVEAHFRLADSPALFPVPFEEAYAAATVLPVAGVPVRTLPPAMALCFAAYHGSKHFWSRLSWSADIAAGLAVPAIDWTEVAAWARRTGTEAHLVFALELARSLYGSPLPGSAAAALQGASPWAHRAAKRGMRAMPLALASSPADTASAIRRVGRLRALRIEVGLFHRLPAKVAVLAVRAAPTQSDQDVIALPPGWRWLYYVIRLMRILKAAARR